MILLPSSPCVAITWAAIRFLKTLFHADSLRKQMWYIFRSFQDVFSSQMSGQERWSYASPSQMNTRKSLSSRPNIAKLLILDESQVINFTLGHPLMLTSCLCAVLPLIHKLQAYTVLIMFILLIWFEKWLSIWLAMALNIGSSLIREHSPQMEMNLKIWLVRNCTEMTLTMELARLQAQIAAKKSLKIRAHWLAIAQETIACMTRTALTTKTGEIQWVI